MTSLPRNIHEQQAANRLDTVLVMTAFVLFFAVLGLGFDTFFLGFQFGGPPHRGLGFPAATLIALAYGGFRAWSSYQSGAQSVLSSAGARPVGEANPQYQQLVNVVDEMSIASGVPRPALYVIPDQDPNAFATGKDPANASIAVTQGLVERLNREELQGVIAHEMSHIRNYDIRLMTVVAALMGAILLLAEFGLRSFRFGGARSKGSSRSTGPIFLVFWLIALLLAPLLSQILALAVSRQREYLADASGAELTRNPNALANALAKIDAAEEPTRSIKKGSAHLCIGDPLGRKANEHEGFFANLFATHPPIEKRITLLRAMAYEHT
jgi:heat shock protein HtpX